MSGQDHFYGIAFIPEPTTLPFSILEGTDRGGSDQQNVWAVVNGILTRLTPYDDPTGTDPPFSEEPNNARLSPDGQWVAYNDNFPGTGGTGVIDVVAADGSSVYPIANRVYEDPTSWAVHPSWHPNGTKVIHCATVGGVQGGKIVVSDFPAGSSTTLWTPQTQSPQREAAFRPHYSPDGTKIAFLVNIAPGGGGTLSRQGLWVMDADGSNDAVIDNWDSSSTNRGYLFSGTQLAWSNDSAWIAYVDRGFGGGGTHSVYKIQPDGTNKTLLADGASATIAHRIGHGAWSDDDTFLVCSRNSGGLSSSWTIHRAEADGSGVTELVNTTDGPAGTQHFETCYRHNDRIYWVYGLSPAIIRSCAIDGSDIQTVYDASIDVDGIFAAGSGVEWI